MKYQIHRAVDKTKKTDNTRFQSALISEIDETSGYPKAEEYWASIFDKPINASQVKDGDIIEAQLIIKGEFKNLINIKVLNETLNVVEETLDEPTKIIQYGTNNRTNDIHRQVYLKIASEHKDKPKDIVEFAKELEDTCKGWLE